MEWCRSVQSTQEGRNGLCATAPPSLIDSGYPEHSTLASVFVNPAVRFQTMAGFGGAFTEAAATTWLGLSPERREALLRAYFDPIEGLNYTLCRVHINSCDFALGNYAHADVAGDVDLQSFNIDRDRQALLPFIKAAQRVAGAPLRLVASPWSPPAWMKSNGQMNHGGKLMPHYRESWANCYVRFIQAYAAEGVAIWGVTVQNEPEAIQRWDSCIYSAEEERDFVRDYLGPALAQAGLAHIKIIIWDHNRDRMVERASVVYSDAEAAKYVWGTGFHWYGENHFEHVQMVHDAWPEKHLLFTEGCQEGGPHIGEWALAERYAQSLINDVNRWTEGWIDWNLLLDETGGPNHAGNLCSAPVLADRNEGKLLFQSSYFAIGQWAKFVMPGAHRVLCAASIEKLECSAFVNPDGGLVVVILNRSNEPLKFRICVNFQEWLCQIPAHAIATHQGTLQAGTCPS